MLSLGAACCALAWPVAARATGVPIGGFVPLVGFGLTDEFLDDFTPYAIPSSEPEFGSIFLGAGGTPHFDIALLDTGAAVSLITSQAYDEFNIDGPYPGEPDGFRGTVSIEIGGATGILLAEINDPAGLYVAGLQSSNRVSDNPLSLSVASLEGQTNTSLITIPAESDLPNVVGLPFASQYATYIRSDSPQIFQHDGRTVRTPHIEFLPLGSGAQGSMIRAPMSLNPGSSFTQPPFWFYNFENFDIDNPQENPSLPTLLSGGLFLTVNAANGNEGFENTQFFFDTGADVTVLSELSAAQLDLDLGNPEFTVAVVGSGGANLEVPGFYIDSFTIQGIEGDVTNTNVPVVVLDVVNPGDPGNIVPGIVGTNLLSGRNAVIDPKPALGGGGVGPSLYIGAPVTTEKNWTTTAASAPFGTGGNWNGGTVPNNLGLANVRHVSGGNQTAVVSADATVWELNVSGGAGQSMTVAVQSGVTLTTFAGLNIEAGGVVQLQNGTLDVQAVEIVGGTLRGSGTVTTGSGPIPGQVENRGGIIAPGNGVGTLEIEGRFANSAGSTLEIELGGIAAGTQYDQLVVDGGAALAGKLAVSLVDLGGGTFAPQVGHTFEIITATEGIGGMFDQLQLPGGIQWDVSYGSGSVLLEVLSLGGLLGDYNGDGAVNAADYAAWRDAMTASSTSLLNDSTPGVVDESDFLYWRAHFGDTLGSGAGASSGAVPEPTSLAMLLAAAAMAFVCRRSLSVATRPVPCAASLRCAS
jgi:hypothetical protein